MGSKHARGLALTSVLHTFQRITMHLCFRRRTRTPSLVRVPGDRG